MMYLLTVKINRTLQSSLLGHQQRRERKYICDIMTRNNITVTEVKLYHANSEDEKLT
jgi:hypothetical protein